MEPGGYTEGDAQSHLTNVWNNKGSIQEGCDKVMRKRSGYYLRELPRYVFRFVSIYHEISSWELEVSFKSSELGMHLNVIFKNYPFRIGLSTFWIVFAIQIKICAEYRDMLPRPRLVCQEPGLRPIGRSPGVPDKSSRGLGSMSRYSAQILICFIAYIFLFCCCFLCGFGWELCRTAIMLSALCHWPL